MHLSIKTIENKKWLEKIEKENMIGDNKGIQKQIRGKVLKNIQMVWLSFASFALFFWLGKISDI